MAVSSGTVRIGIPSRALGLPGPPGPDRGDNNQRFVVDVVTL